MAGRVQTGDRGESGSDMRTFLIAGLAAGALLSTAVADNSVLPNPRLTPGAVSESRTAVICEPGYSRAHRVWHDKAGTLAKYGIPYSDGWQYEDDDLVPVCLGGDNSSPLNHWPQPNSANPGAADKDRLEWRICAEVCRARDDALLERYQAAFAKEWTVLLQTKQQK